MPESRMADVQLSCLDGSVFLDFSYTKDNFILLHRISFDGYGCCDFIDTAKPLNKEDSKLFIEEINKATWNQQLVETLVNKAIAMNRNNIWRDALVDYGFTSN